MRRRLGNTRMWEKERDPEERMGDRRHSRESPELSHGRWRPRDDGAAGVKADHVRHDVAGVRESGNVPLLVPLSRH